jgi:hypothetical protein
VEPFRLEIPYAPHEGRRTGLLLLSGTLVIGGLAWALTSSSALPLSASALGCALYATLLLKHPVYQYIVAVKIDSEGIWYLREPRPDAAAGKLLWHEVKGLSARLASHGEENPGLEVMTTRFGPKGTPILVPIGSEPDCLAALHAAKSFANMRAAGAA